MFVEWILETVNSRGCVWQNGICWSAEFAAALGNLLERLSFSLCRSHWIRDSEAGRSHQWLKKPPDILKVPVMWRGVPHLFVFLEGSRIKNKIIVFINQSGTILDALQILLECLKWSEVAQSCLTLCNPMDCIPPGSSVHEFSRQEYWSGLPFLSAGDLPDPGMNPGLLHCGQMLYRLSHQGSPQLGCLVLSISISLLLLHREPGSLRE